MGDEKLLRMGVCLLPILVFIVGAFEEIDEAMYLFLTSHFEPPPQCPENELYKTCFSNCSDCERRGVCGRAEGCGQRGCDCRQNFVRLVAGGRCEPVHSCPVRECGEKEAFRECGPVCERCGGMRCRMLQCEHTCYCREGHLREQGGRCVPEDECPPKVRCSRDEEMGTSGRKDEYCLRAEDEPTTETTDRCYCREGFSRNSMGHCVADEFCTMVRCMRGEEYQPCPKKCNATCRTYGDTSCKEDGQCFPGCFCPEGLIMNDFRACVPLNECPTGSNPLVPTASSISTPTMTESITSASTASLSTPRNDTADSILTTVHASDSSTTPMTAHASDSSTTHTTVHASDSSTTPMTVHASDSSTTHTTVHASDSSTTHTPVHASDSSTTPTTVHDSESTVENYVSTSGLPEDVEISIVTSAADATRATPTPQPPTQSTAQFRAIDAPPPRDRAGGKSPESTSEAKDREEDRDDVLPTTTEKPKSWKKPGKEKKEATKAITPVDMDEQNE